MQGQCPGHTMYNNFIKPLIFASWNIKKKYLFCPIFGPDFIQYLGASTDFSWYKDGYLEIMFLTQGSCHNKKCWHSMMFAPIAIFDCSSLFSSSLLHTVFLIQSQHSHIVTNFFFLFCRKVLVFWGWKLLLLGNFVCWVLQPFNENFALEKSIQV